MKKNECFILFFVFLFSACTSMERFHEDNLQVHNEPLRVFVANSLEEATVPLPVSVYVFNAAKECIDVQTLQTVEKSFVFTLPLGKHTLYVLSGASPDKYALPGKEEATPEYSIALKTGTKLHAELAAKTREVLITSGGVNDLTITVDRIIAQLTASISDIPDDVSAVSITLEPLEEEVLLNGTYGGDGSDKVSFNLSKAADGLWKTSEALYLLPGTNNVSVAITLTDADGLHPYTYATPIPLKANSKTDIIAAYKAGSAELSGKIQCSDWAKEYEVSFDFGEGADADTNTPDNNEILTQGDIYKGCYILDVISETPQKSTLLLMHPQTIKDKIRVDFANIKDTEYQGITGWRMLNRPEAETLYHFGAQDINAFNDILKDAGIDIMEPEIKYIYLNIKELECFKVNTPTFINEPTDTEDKYSARIVAAVEVEWE